MDGWILLGLGNLIPGTLWIMDHCKSNTCFTAVFMMLTLGLNCLKQRAKGNGRCSSQERMIQ